MLCALKMPTLCEDYHKFCVDDYGGSTSTLNGSCLSQEATNILIDSGVSHFIIITIVTMCLCKPAHTA